MAADVRIWLLGGFRVRLDSRLVADGAWRRNKAKAVVKMLALAPRHQLHREHLMDTLWPELAPEAAAANLRKALHFARQALGQEHLRGREELLRLEAPRLWVDVEAFEAAADAVDLAAAIELYAGELLPEDRFEPWVQERQEQLRNLFAQVLLARAAEQEAAGEPAAAAATLERLATADPLNEQAVSGLMRAYARAGQRHLALGWYRQLEAGLAEELGVQPVTQARQLRDEIAAGSFPPAPGPGATATVVRARPEAEPSIAVLPFVDLSPEGDHEYFCSGIAEELIGALSTIDGLRVASRTSSFRFGRERVDVRGIGEQLSVAAVVEGSVRRFEDDLRVAVRLVDARSGFQLWSERFDRDFADLFRIQEEIAQHIVAALRVHISADDEKTLGRVVAPDVQAYDLYLQGRHNFYRGGRSSTRRASDLFQRAAELAPDYALAYAGSADANSFLYLYYEPSHEHLERALAWSRRAVEADPDLPEARASRGHALAARGDYDQAAEEFEEALRLRAESFETLYLYGRACLAAGRFREAAQLFGRACTARPDDFHAATLHAKALRGLGEAPAAVAVHQRALDLVEHHLRLVPDDARARCDGMCALVELGRGAEAQRWAEQARAATPDPMLYYIACGYARAGLRSHALETLTDSIEAGWSHADWLRNDPDWSDYRGEERFRSLLERLDRLRGRAETGEIW
jgi:adenylate cyclase